METNKSLFEIEVALAKLPEFDFRKNIVAYNINGISDRLPIWHECDMLVCSKSGYLTEIEIKRSWSDFLADFKKKHKHESEGLIKYFYYCLPSYFELEKTYKILEENDILYSGIYFYDDYLNFQFHAAKIRDDYYANRSMICKKLFIEQQLEIARLASMRVIGLKEKLNKLVKL